MSKELAQLATEYELIKSGGTEELIDPRMQAEQYPLLAAKLEEHIGNVSADKANIIKNLASSLKRLGENREKFAKLNSDMIASQGSEDVELTDDHWSLLDTLMTEKNSLDDAIIKGFKSLE